MITNFQIFENKERAAYWSLSFENKTDFEAALLKIGCPLDFTKKWFPDYDQHDQHVKFDFSLYVLKDIDEGWRYGSLEEETENIIKNNYDAKYMGQITINEGDRERLKIYKETKKFNI